MHIARECRPVICDIGTDDREEREKLEYRVLLREALRARKLLETARAKSEPGTDRCIITRTEAACKFATKVGLDCRKNTLRPRRDVEAEETDEDKPQGSADAEHVEIQASELLKVSANYIHWFVHLMETKEESERVVIEKIEEWIKTRKPNDQREFYENNIR